MEGRFERLVNWRERERERDGERGTFGFFDVNKSVLSCPLNAKPEITCDKMCFILKLSHT